MDVTTLVNELGGIARTARLLDRGMTPARIAGAVSSGEIIRVHRGWYATARVPAAVVTAVRGGGRVGCTTALRLQGVWTISDPLVHVCIDRTDRIDVCGEQ